MLFGLYYLGHVISEMKNVFNITEDTETRLWNKYMSNSCELLPNMEQTVQEVGLYQGQVRQMISQSFLSP